MADPMTYSPDLQTDIQLEAESMMQRAKARSSETIEDAVDLVRRHPGKTIIASVVVGSLIGAWIVSSLSEDEPDRMEAWAELGREAWDKMKGSTSTVLESLRDALDAATAKFSR